MQETFATLNCLQFHAHTSFGLNTNFVQSETKHLQYWRVYSVNLVSHFDIGT